MFASAAKRNLVKGVASMGAVAALYAVKTGPIDGPLFKEDVDMRGKEVIITGGENYLHI